MSRALEQASRALLVEPPEEDSIRTAPVTGPSRDPFGGAQIGGSYLENSSPLNDY